MFDAGVPPTFPITFANVCQPPGACGGDPSGLWTYSNYCVPDDAFTPLVSSCGATFTQVTNKQGTARGAVLFTPTQVARDVVVQAAFTITTTSPTCVGACASLGSVFSQRGAMASCSLQLPDGGASATTCSCSVLYQFADRSSETYTRSQGTLTTSSGRTWNYCITSNSLRARETTANANDFGISTMTR